MLRRIQFFHSETSGKSIYIHMSHTYIPTNLPTPTPSHIYSNARIYLDVEGVMANFTKQAALALDNMKIPVSETGILISPNPVYTLTSKEIMYDVCHGFDFYASMEKYPWSDILFEELFKITNQNVYFISRQSKWDRESWGGKAHWIWQNYGQYGYDHLMMISDTHEMSHRGKLEEKDILIDDFVDPYINRWCAAGGTGFHWSEMDPRSEQDVISNELYRRLSELKELIRRVG